MTATRSADKDPICMKCRAWAGRVSWPADLNPGPNDPSASTYVCADQAHQADAAEWVEAVTGRRGVFVPWERADRGAALARLSSAPAVEDSTPEDAHHVGRDVGPSPMEVPHA